MLYTNTSWLYFGNNEIIIFVLYMSTFTKSKGCVKRLSPHILNPSNNMLNKFHQKYINHVFYLPDLLYRNYLPQDPDEQDTILRKLSDYCGKSMTNYTTPDQEPPFKWDFYHSFFFSYTVVSTIGKILVITSIFVFYLLVSYP